MSKQIKQMQMDALKADFHDVRDLVLLSVSGLNAQIENTLRLQLRKKNIRMQMVKNSLARRVFTDLGLKTTSEWTGPTVLAWGSDSLAGLSQEIEGIRKKNEKTIKPKFAVADGQEVSFAQALKMPTKPQAIGRVVMLALSPAARIVGAIKGPGGKVVGQIKSLKDKEGAPAEGAPAAG